MVAAFNAIKPGNTTNVDGDPLLQCDSLEWLLLVSQCVWNLLPLLLTLAHNQFGKIILRCNKGSTTSFYCALGYLGFLALSILTITFLTLRPPGRSNKPKTITFSMLIFCSMWISFIPTYLSTKGRAMVVLEHFSILASRAGLLGWIFLPECDCFQVILLRSDKNSRKKGISLIFKNWKEDQRHYDNVSPRFLE